MRFSGESVEVESGEETDSEFPFALFSRLLCLCKVAAIQYSYFLICTIGITGTDLLWSGDKSSACTAIKMAVITAVAVRLNTSGLYPSTVLKNQRFFAPRKQNDSSNIVNHFLFDCVLNCKISHIYLSHIFNSFWIRSLECCCFFVMRTWLAM